MKRKLIITMLILFIASAGALGYYIFIKDKDGTTNTKTKLTKEMLNNATGNKLSKKTVSAFLYADAQRIKLESLKFDNYNDFVVLAEEVKKPLTPAK